MNFQQQRRADRRCSHKAASIRSVSTHPATPLPELESRPLIDQQLVQYLLEFAGKSPILAGLSGDNINSLIQALIVGVAFISMILILSDF